MVEMVCSVCEVRPEAMAVYKGKVYCFACLADKFPELTARLVAYLTTFKRIKPEAEVAQGE